MPCLECATDRWREQHRHAFGLTLVPCRYQATGVFEHLSLRRTLRGSLLLGGCGALRFHLALVETHDVDFGYCLSSNSMLLPHSRHDAGEGLWRLNGVVRGHPPKDPRIGSRARSALTRYFRPLNRHRVPATASPSSRAAWHTHPLGQILIVTFGCGWVQREGGPVEKIHPGDVVWFSPGEKHWHGAMPTTAMSHIAIQEALNGKAVDWMEHVSDEQYRR